MPDLPGLPLHLTMGNFACRLAEEGLGTLAEADNAP
jgi:hypothetical protein